MAKIGNFQPQGMLINVQEERKPNEEQTVQETARAKVVITSNERVILNAKGVKFEVLLDALDFVPASRLSLLKEFVDKSKNNDASVSEININEICDAYSNDLNEFYFNKDPEMVRTILKFYENDVDDRKTHIFATSLCALELKAAFEYWRIDYKQYLDVCCLRVFESAVESKVEMIETEERIIKEYTFRENFGTRFFPKIRQTIWYVMEKPKSSIWSLIYALFSAFMTILSIIEVILR
jgi:hypothetical protein